MMFLVYDPDRCMCQFSQFRVRMNNQEVLFMSNSLRPFCGDFRLFGQSRRRH